MKNFKEKLGYALCIMLLTCTFCLAHNTSNEVSVTNTVKLCNDSTELKSVGVDTVMVKLMIEYEIECYNDSMEVITHECPANMPGCLVYHTWYKTIHKEPTFKDFVRWVANKYGF